MLGEPRQAPRALAPTLTPAAVPTLTLTPAAVPALIVAGIITVSGTTGCDRLNPDWCKSAVRCPSSEYCDPSTNACRPREQGVGDAARDRRAADGAMDDRRRSELDPCAFPSGGYTCVGGAVARCGDRGPAMLRNCPLGQCAYGHCQTSAPIRACTKNADCAPWLCTMLLSGAGTPTNVCAAPVSGALSAATCNSGLDCSSGLCTPSGRCYYACNADGDCPQNYQCKAALNLLVEGVTVTSKSCEP